MIVVRRWLRGVTACVAVIALVMGVAPAATADAVRDRQWYLDFLDIAETHQISRGKGVTVAVLDTGVDASHPDLAGNVVGGTNLWRGSGDGRSDPNGHGTGTASLIAGHGHGPGDRAGILGMAPEATILPVTVFNTEAVGNENAVIQGIHWAADHGADVINLSLGGGANLSWGDMRGGGRRVRKAVRYALERDAVVVAAAGNANQGDLGLLSLAATPGVIAVSGVNRAGQFVAETSVQGEGVVLAAPSDDVNFALPKDKGGYASSSGTSSSAALVSGVAALIRAEYPELNAASVIKRLIKTAQDKGPQGRDPMYGYGVVDPVAALTADIAPTQRNPLGMPKASAPPGGLAKGPGDPSANPGAADDNGGSAVAGLLVGSGIVAVLVLGGLVLLIVLLGRRRRPAPAGHGPAGPRGPGGNPPPYLGPPGSAPMGPYPQQTGPPHGPPPGPYNPPHR